MQVILQNKGELKVMALELSFQHSNDRTSKWTSAIVSWTQEQPGLDLMFSCCILYAGHAKFTAEISQQRDSRTVLTTYIRDKFLFSEALSALILHIG